MSLAYRVDELLALRDSVSESAVSIEKFPDEDVIRGQWTSISSSRLFTFTVPLNRLWIISFVLAYTTLGFSPPAPHRSR